MYERIFVMRVTEPFAWLGPMGFGSQNDSVVGIPVQGMANRAKSLNDPATVRFYRPDLASPEHVLTGKRACER